MQRRNFLKGVIAAGGCLACAGIARASGDVAWGYNGSRGPESWGGLSGNYKACELGTQQSPIDISGAIRANVGPIELDWKSAPAELVNNGHTIQLDVSPGSTLKQGGNTYELLQFHFHAPSEHQIDGRAFPMEIHFVHREAKTGALAVLGLMVDEGGRSNAFRQLTAIFPSESGQKERLETANPATLLPDNLDYFSYAGSLTTPPCSEIVTWLVLKTPLLVDARAIARFTKIYKENARPVAPVNRRLILKSF